MREQIDLQLVVSNNFENVSFLPRDPVDRSRQKTLLSLNPIEAKASSLDRDEDLSPDEIASQMGYSTRHMEIILKRIARKINDRLHSDHVKGLIPSKPPPSGNPTPLISLENYK